jgi:hypothetical protein
MPLSQSSDLLSCYNARSGSSVESREYNLRFRPLSMCFHIPVIIWVVSVERASSNPEGGGGEIGESGKGGDIFL